MALFSFKKEIKEVKDKGIVAETNVKTKSKVKGPNLSKNPGKAPVQDMIFTLQNLAVMLKTGLPIEEAIDVVAQQSQSKALRSAYTLVLQDINSGMSLADAMKKRSRTFSPLIISIINAGEQGGTLEKNLSYLADFLKKNYVLMKKIKAALFYPIIIITMTFGEVIGVIFFILPQLETFFSSFAAKGSFTTYILAGGKFIRVNGLFFLIVAIMIGVGLHFFLKTIVGKFTRDVVFLHTPVIKKLVISITLANFSRTFGTLLESGLPMYNALTLSKETMGNQLYYRALADVQQKILSGMSLADCMKHHGDLFPNIFTKMLEVGEKAGALETNLLSMHEYYASSAEDLSNTVAALIEPILLIFVGLVVAGLAISIIGPLYSVISSIHG